VDGERAETYLRQLAEAELRSRRGDALDRASADAARVRAVASAFTQIGALDADLANSIVEDLTAALDLRPPVDRAVLLTSDIHGNLEPVPVPPAAARARVSITSMRASSSRRATTPTGMVSVLPVGELLELRDGQANSDVYFLAVITTATGVSLCTGIHSLPPGSPPRRRAPNHGLHRQAPSLFPRMVRIPGVLSDLIAVDDAGRFYNALFIGGGGRTWEAGEFRLVPSQRGPRRAAQQAWLDVGTGQNSARIDLTAQPPQVPVTMTPNGLSAAEQILRIRCEALLTKDRLEIREGLPLLSTVVAALRAIGALPGESLLPGQIAALCDRHEAQSGDAAGPSGALPERWTAILMARDRADRWDEPDGEDGPAAAARLFVTFPETDGIEVALFGVIARGDRVSLHGAFFGAVEEDEPDRCPSIWLRDDTGQWHVAEQNNWSGGDVVVFAADIIPPIGPQVSSADILLVSRSADLHARVPLTWWTS
jgi:hypothetical protein